jgi:hypothetical protein
MITKELTVEIVDDLICIKLDGEDVVSGKGFSKHYNRIGVLEDYGFTIDIEEDNE